MKDTLTLPPANILDALPHRPPFRFLTSILVLEPEASGEAVWSVDGTEPFFTGHFPHQPIVPGVLIAEALAQLSGLIAYSFAGSGRPMDAEANRAVEEGKLAHADVRFKQSVAPPADLVLRSRLVLKRGSLRQFEVEAQSDRRLVARGRLILTGRATLAAHADDRVSAP